MKIIISTSRSSIKIDKIFIKKIVEIVLQKEKVKTDEVHINFVTKKKIKELHLQFFNDPTITDCISFPIDRPSKKVHYHLLGEVFICSDTAKIYAKKNKIDLKEEIALYVIHSILHLIGYNDIKENEIKIMRKKENFYLNHLKS